MSLTLSLAIAEPKVTHHTEVVAEVTLSNQGAKALELPSLFDNSTALSFTILDDQDQEIYQLDGISFQKMLVGIKPDGRPDTTVLLQSLPPGGTWQRSFRLCQFHRLLPVAARFVVAEFIWAEQDVALTSDPVAIEVIATPLQAVSTSIDNPVFEGVSLLLTEPESDGAAYLRMMTAGNPLASWYSARLSGFSAGKTLIAAAPNYFDTESFEPFFERWVISCRQGKLKAERFADGQPLNETLTADLPTGRTLLPSAFYNLDQEVHVLCLTEKGQLECYRLSDTDLDLVFSHQLPALASSFAGDGSQLVVRVDARFIHVFLPEPGIRYQRLTLAGNLDQDQVLFQSKLMPFSCQYHPSEARIKAIQWDGPTGRTVHLQTRKLDVSAANGQSGLGPSQTHELDPLPLDGQVQEMAYDVDEGGNFHLLVSTSLGKLNHLDASGLALEVATGPGPFLPTVICRTANFLGYYRPEVGHRFVEYRPGRAGSPLLDNESV